MKVGILHDVWRPDEELLAVEAAKRGHEVIRIQEGREHLVVAPPPRPGELDVVLERCRDHGRALAALACFESREVPAVNSLAVARTCGNKVYCSAALARAGVPTPQTAIAFSIPAALEAAEAIGYPVMLKPTVGDMGALVARADDREQARALLAHKQALGGAHAAVFYVQRRVERPGRDLRAFVIGDELVAATWFISNREAASETDAIIAEAEPTAELARLARDAARAVGGGALAVDLLEAPEGLLVSEVNYTIEFSALGGSLPTRIAGRMVDLVERVAHRPR